jgi:hypothetical protein
LVILNALGVMGFRLTDWNADATGWTGALISTSHGTGFQMLPYNVINQPVQGQSDSSAVEFI